VSDVSAIVCDFDPSAGTSHGLDLAPMNMDLGVREVSEAACVIEVQVCHDDVPDAFAWVSEVGELADGGALGVHVNAEVLEEEANHGRRSAVVVQAESRVYQDRAFVGIHEEASSADVPAGEPGGHSCAVQDSDCHRENARPVGLNSPGQSKSSIA
jgi:hypothetical protein